MSMRDDSDADIYMEGYIRILLFILLVIICMLALLVHLYDVLF